MREPNLSLFLTLAAPGLRYLSLASMVVASSGTSFAFNVSQVTQCEPVFISFSGSLENDKIPTRITLIPSNAQVLYIDLPTSGLQNTATGVNVTFFPLPANTTFLVSLDRQGHAVAPVTDFLTVRPSNNAACLESATLPSPHIFQISQNLSSCQSFTVTYNSSLIQTTPKIQLLTGNQSAAGEATYDLPSVSKEFILSIDGGDALTQTLLVQSDANSTALKCSHGTDHNMVSTAVQTSNSSDSLRVGTIVGVSIGTAAIVLCAIAVVIFVYRERRRNTRAMPRFSLIDEKREKPLPALPTEDTESAFMEIATFNPPYVYRSSGWLKDYTPPGSANQFNTKNASATSRNSITEDSRSQISQRRFLDSLFPTTTQPSFLVLTDVDGSSSEEGAPSSKNIPPPSTTQSQTLTPPPSVFSFRRHSPLDVPKDLTPVRLSFSSSSVGVNPSSHDSRLMVSLPFEGLDDSSRKSDSITDHPRTRKIVEERPSFASRKKVTFADDVGDSNE
ncbi:hypothetical protein F5887DRAFT_1245688 [Amanita rubescens]|nr:hypothetical protein F5887DRAFT_1245688 [Amanita rubescens]